MDIISYLLGLATDTGKHNGTITLEGDYVFTDTDNDGNIVITKSEE